MKRANGLIVLFVVLVSFCLSTFVLYTPIPQHLETGFSAVEAAGHIAEIAREPHSVFDRSAHETVRQYLIDQFEGYIGAGSVTEMNYAAADVDPDIAYDVENLLAVIPGDSPKGILIVAHYDSRGHIGRYGELGHSYGAADDGYGLAVLLEIARLYGERDVSVLRFVRQSRQLGFSMPQIAALIGLWGDAQRSSREVKAVAQRHLADLEEKRREIEQMMEGLADVVHTCQGDDRPDCAILDKLSLGSAAELPPRHQPQVRKRTGKVEVPGTTAASHIDLMAWMRGVQVHHGAH